MIDMDDKVAESRMSLLFPQVKYRGDLFGKTTFLIHSIVANGETLVTLWINKPSLKRSLIMYWATIITPMELKLWTMR
jgi:hypothetical protein